MKREKGSDVAEEVVENVLEGSATLVQRGILGGGRHLVQHALELQTVDTVFPLWQALQRQALQPEISVKLFSAHVCAQLS